MRYAQWFVTMGVFVGAVSAGADDKAPAQAKPPEPITRLFVQDLKTCSLKWADVTVGADKKLALGPLAGVTGFKKLDPAKQKLVQMRESGSLVCVGVRDDAEGTFESGWVLVRSGVGYADHGDHGHWAYKKAPEVIDSRLDAKQGNPAHLYLYDGWFYLANDRLNGYTRIDPGQYATNEGRALGKGKPQFVTGGGGHITLAVVDNKVGYGCWIDGGGPNKGRVDVSPVGVGARPEPAYSFALPSGGTHGATACAGKVFFAPSAGVCWVDADPGLKLKSEQVKVRHIDLGTEGDRPRRTGAFATHGHHVLFVTGKDAPNLVVLNAKHPDPKPVFLPLAVKKGAHAGTPEVVTSADGKTYALVFHDRVKDSDAADALEVIALDPNGDGDFSDAKSVKVLTVGKSAVEGHFGHHSIAFDADRRYGFFTNPGDGTLSALSLKTLDVVATFTVGGTPTAVVARGGEDHDD
ncbi:MAG TPA: hypothetical protein VGE74_17020 [Gemmata sp.]